MAIDQAVETKAEKLARIRAEIEAEQAKLDDGKEDRAIAEAMKELEKMRTEREERELRERIEAETGEKFGDALAMLRTVKGPIVLKRGLQVTYTKFTRLVSKTGKVGDEAAEEFVRALRYYPDADKAAEIFEALPGVMTDASTVGVQLYGFRGKSLSGKS